MASARSSVASRHVHASRHNLRHTSPAYAGVLTHAAAQRLCARKITAEEKTTVKTPRVLGLALALMAALMVPSAAISQAKKPVAPPAVSPAAIKAGVAQAPAIVPSTTPVWSAKTRKPRSPTTRSPVDPVPLATSCKPRPRVRPPSSVASKPTRRRRPANRHRHPACCPETTIRKPCSSR